MSEPGNPLGRRGLAAASGSDLISLLRELSVVFRAESGIACRLMLGAERVPCAAPIRDAIYRTVRCLLKRISTHRRATAVTLSSGTDADGSVFIRVDNDAPGPVARGNGVDRSRGSIELSTIVRRLTETGVYVEIDDNSLRARIVVPSRLMGGC